MPPTVRITIPRKGIATGKADVTIDAEGYMGQGCKTATEAFMNLGQAETSDKPELYQSDIGQEHLREGE